MISRFRSIVLVTVLTGALAGIPFSAGAEALQGITAPIADITLSFVVPGRVSDVLVKEGSMVEKDQLLIRLYDEPERIQSQELKLLSEDRTKIHAAEAELAQKIGRSEKGRAGQIKGSGQ